MKETYDVAIIGTGPAGLSASIYSSRYKLKNIVFGKTPGGTITEGHKICNYPGYEEITGMELGMKMYNHAKKEGGEIVNESIVDIKKDGDIFKLTSDNEKVYVAKTVILATGTDRNKLAIPGEDKYLGKGVSYCATCDGMFYRGKTVGVIGGSSAATMAAVMLSDIAEKVYIIYRGNELRGEPAWASQAQEKENIEIIYQTLLTELNGNGRLEGVKLSKPYNGSESLKLDGIFIEIGSEPNITLPLEMGVKIDDHNYIVVDQEQKTNMEGIWAAGDCTTNSNYLKQAVTAASEGAVAANSIYMYLKQS
ncbi:MAG: NAD(P)/FAD-dependent oxidoreductase [Candidatus Dojkabacteria bacterium]|jgi:thioredoxin reductase (NADPH)